MKTRIQAESALGGEFKSELERLSNGADARASRASRGWTKRMAAALRRDGAASLYVGAWSKTAHSISSSFLYFLAFSGMKRRYEERTGGKIGTGATLLVAAAAGCLNVLVTEPLDTYVTRKQLENDAKKETTSSEQSYDVGLKETLRALRENEVAAERQATPGLYSGLGASLVLTINPAIQYTVFEQLRQRLMTVLNARAQGRGDSKRVVELSTFDAFLMGAASKAVATMITYPLVRAKVLQKACTRQEEARSLVGTLERVYREEGVRGLYKGLDAQLVKTVLAGAIMMTVKEKSFSSAFWMVLAIRGEESSRKNH